MNITQTHVNVLAETLAIVERTDNQDAVTKHVSLLSDLFGAPYADLVLRRAQQLREADKGIQRAAHQSAERVIIETGSY